MFFSCFKYQLKEVFRNALNIKVYSERELCCEHKYFFIRQNKSQKEAPFDFYSSVILGLIGFCSKKSVLKSPLMNTSCSIMMAMTGSVVYPRSGLYVSHGLYG